jgi:hypothetical protein
MTRKLQSIGLIRSRGTDVVSRYSIFEIPSREIQALAQERLSLAFRSFPTVLPGCLPPRGTG